jgi:hypothetical protein
MKIQREENKVVFKSPVTAVGVGILPVFLFFEDTTPVR